MGKRKNKKRTTSQMSARTKAVNKKAKEMSRRVKRGTAGTANAKGTGSTKASGGGHSSSLTSTRKGGGGGKIGKGRKGSGGNLYNKKTNKRRG